MIRVLTDRLFAGDKHYIEAVGLSTDAKPTTGLITGSTFIEQNTGDMYMFDEESATWGKFPPDAEQAEEQSGGE